MVHYWASDGRTRYATDFTRERAGGATTAPVAIIEHPDVRRTLMRMKALTQGARALLYYAAARAVPR